MLSSPNQARVNDMTYAEETGCQLQADIHGFHCIGIQFDTLHGSMHNVCRHDWSYSYFSDRKAAGAAAFLGEAMPRL